MAYVSSEQLARAREMDLLTYLQQYEPEELVHFSGNTYTTRTHDSLKISNGKWCWWSKGIGGSTALDYLIKVRGLSLPEAVSVITGLEIDRHKDERPLRAAMPSAPLPFILPPKHADNRRVFAYLKSRGIAPEIINHCIKHGQLYEDGEHHNCVFVGFEGSTPKYGALRSTLSGSVFSGDVSGSDKRFSFAMPKEPSENPALCVFESAIDALSYLSILCLKGHDWRKTNCLSIAGVYPPRQDGRMKLPLALREYLKNNPQIQKVILCLDNDEPGRSAAIAIKEQLAAEYEVVDEPPQAGKDYNDLLQKMKGLEGKNRTRGETR